MFLAEKYTKQHASDGEHHAGTDASQKVNQPPIHSVCIGLERNRYRFTSNAAIVREYLNTIGKERALELTGQEIHDAIFDECGESIPISTVHQVRHEFAGTKKQRLNGNFNRPFQRPRTH